MELVGDFGNGHGDIWILDWSLLLPEQLPSMLRGLVSGDKTQASARVLSPT
jgi:hypothetical protein